MKTYPIPSFFDKNKVNEIWKVDYESRAADAKTFALQHDLKPFDKLRTTPVSASTAKTSLMLIDVQNTFCIPNFELFVGGRSGNGAVEDNMRLCEFIYKNIGNITHIIATMDTHTAHQIFHPNFFVDKDGNHPTPYSNIYVTDLQNNTWKFNPALASQFNIAPEYGQQMMIHYAEALQKKGKFALTIWPYHAMLGGLGHALVPAVEEAIFFHSIARNAQADFEIKGNKPFTENYSAIGPEVLTGPMGETLGSRNPKFIQHLQEVDRLYIAGQAKSHCVAWTISDLLDDIQAVDSALAHKVYLLEDCSSPVVVPNIVDHTDAANEAFAKFTKAGMRIVKSTDEII